MEMYAIIFDIPYYFILIFRSFFCISIHIFDMQDIVISVHNHEMVTKIS